MAYAPREAGVFLRGYDKTWLKLLVCKIFRVGSCVRKPSKLLVNNVKICRSTAVPKDRIFPLPKIDDGFKELCRKVFEMDTEWKNSALWLSQPATSTQSTTSFTNYMWWESASVIPGVKLVESGFIYSSETNKEWLSVDEIKAKLKTDIERHD